MNPLYHLRTTEHCSLQHWSDFNSSNALMLRVFCLPLTQADLKGSFLMLRCPPQFTHIINHSRHHLLNKDPRQLQHNQTARGSEVWMALLLGTQNRCPKGQVQYKCLKKKWRIRLLIFYPKLLLKGISVQLPSKRKTEFLQMEPCRTKKLINT